MGKLKEGEKPSRELEERNLVNEAKLRDLENKINENNSEKGEVFYPGDTVEFDGDKIIKVEKSKEEEIIPTPEEVKTEKPKETGTENSKEATNENKETAIPLN